MAFRDIRKSRKWLSIEEIRLLLLGLVLLISLLALNLYLARILPGGEQLFVRWSGAHAFLEGSFEPYGATIAQRTQNVAYGRDASSTEYPYYLNDPFYIVLLYMPLAWIPNFAVARGVWMLLSEVLLMVLVFTFIRSLEWEPPGWLYFLLMLSSVFGYYSLVAVRSGTPAIAITVLVFLIVYSLHSFSDELAGASLFLVAYQWEVGALFFFFILVFAFANRRWRVFYGFGMALAILLAVSFLSYPDWTLPFVRGVLSDWYRSSNLTFGSIISAIFPDIRFPLGLWTTILLGVIVFIEWLGTVNSPYRHIVWTVCLSLAVMPLMGMAIFPSNHVSLVPSLILIIMLIWERWKRQRVWFSLLVVFSALIVPYWLYYRVLSGAPATYSQLLMILPSVATIIGLYWMRWWTFRSPRTWFDKLGDRT